MKKHIPWTDKYRPIHLDDFVSHEDIKNFVKNILTSFNLPHLLFYGPPGTGKTSMILTIARHLYGTKKLYDNILELNASDERGIGVVRNKISSFAKYKIPSPDPDFPSPEFKIIILDEVDTMTTDAQSALRKIIEMNSKITRFCLICNYIEKIIAPLKSRCTLIYFLPIQDEYILKRLNEISQKEKLVLNKMEIDKESNINLKDTFDFIVKHSRGDMRKAITLLQNVNYFTIRKYDDLYKIVNFMNPNEFKLWFDKLLETKEHNVIFQNVDNVISDCFIIGNMYDQILSYINEKEDISSEIKFKISKLILISAKCLESGADDFLQLLNIIITIKSLIE